LGKCRRFSLPGLASGDYYLVKPHKSMKRIHILLGLGLTVVVAHADLIIETREVTPQMTKDGVLRIKGAKIRADVVGDDKSLIIDSNTGDELTLSHERKEALRTSLLKFRQTARYTNAIAAKARLPKPRSTGKTEKVNGYDTEIYAWTNSYGMPVTLWVAMNFPNLARIKKELAALDKLNDTYMEKYAPDSSEVPGMCLKMQSVGVSKKDVGLTNTTTLVSVREETIDASIFEVPKDYHEVTSP
jgi:Domain of unknown function (DUF4412)